MEKAKNIFRVKLEIKNSLVILMGFSTYNVPIRSFAEHFPHTTTSYTSYSSEVLIKPQPSPTMMMTMMKNCCSS